MNRLESIFRAMNRAAAAVAVKAVAANLHLKKEIDLLLRNRSD